MNEILQTLQNDLTFYLVMFCVLLFGGLAIWMMAKMRSLTEVNHLKSEIDRLELQQYEKLENCEDQCQQIEEEIRVLLSDLRNSMTKGEVDKVKGIRNTISHTICTDFVDAYYRYTRLASRLYKNDAVKMESFLNKKLLPFLEVSGNVVSVINQRNVLAMAEAKSLVIHTKTFAFATDLVETTIGTFDFTKRKEFNRQISQLNLKAA